MPEIRVVYSPLMRFAPEYVRHVLHENFEDAKALFLSPLLAVHYAHLVMLAERGIVSAGDAHAIRLALDGISEEGVRRVSFDGTCEDLFFYVDRLIVQTCGEDVAGRLHTARSRNDIDMTMFRIRQRGFVLDLLDATVELRRALLGIASRHLETVFPAHTHTQPAQPTTVAHYLLGAIEQLERDAVRLNAAFATTNRSPLGACAITGTGFSIDRQRTADLLGFDGPTGNTYGSIATVDYLLESLSAASVALVGLGRLLQDLLLWCTAEFRYLRLPEGFVQGSSIMPQKRNPVALEHARAIASKALGEAAGVLVVVHNTPFGDIVDTEDDLQPLVHVAFRDATRAVRVAAAALCGADFDRELMATRAAEHWITATELADTLTRDEGVSFRASHEIATRLISFVARDPGLLLSQGLAAVSREVIGRTLTYSDDKIARILSPRNFVEVRRTPGGPAPEEAASAVSRSEASAGDDAGWIERVRGAIATAASRLREEADKL
jgi:argininosuccinate lyase